jgi:hypothetical protein
MLALSGRAAERDLDDLLLVATVTVHSTFLSMRSSARTERRLPAGGKS